MKKNKSLISIDSSSDLFGGQGMTIKEAEKLNGELLQIHEAIVRELDRLHKHWFEGLILFKNQL